MIKSNDNNIACIDNHIVLDLGDARWRSRREEEAGSVALFLTGAVPGPAGTIALPAAGPERETDKSLS